MKSRYACLTGFCIACVITTVPADADENSAGKAAPVATTPAELSWQPVPGLPFMAAARVWGTPEAAQGRFVKFSEKKSLPLHKHTASVRVVVVSGTYVYGREGEPEKHFPAGSFVFTPGGTSHVAGCDAPCVYYEEVDGKPDITVVPAK